MGSFCQFIQDEAPIDLVLNNVFQGFREFYYIMECDYICTYLRHSDSTIETGICTMAQGQASSHHIVHMLCV